MRCGPRRPRNAGSRLKGSRSVLGAKGPVPSSDLSPRSVAQCPRLGVSVGLKYQRGGVNAQMFQVNFVTLRLLGEPASCSNALPRARPVNNGAANACAYRAPGAQHGRKKNTTTELSHQRRLRPTTSSTKQFTKSKRGSPITQENPHECAARAT